jgi:hypothetical protein
VTRHLPVSFAFCIVYMIRFSWSEPFAPASWGLETGHVSHHAGWAGECQNSSAALAHLYLSKVRGTQRRTYFLAT